MDSKRQQQRKKYKFLIIGGVTVLIIIVLMLVASLLVHDDGSGRQKQLQMVTILTPPPPPKIEEVPPEPEEPKEEIETPEEEQPADEPEDQSQDLPTSEDLGLDADAGLGGDAFGLKAKKGGRDLIGGDGAGSLYGWYANLVSSDLQKIANDIIQKDGGMPSGKWGKVTFEVMLDVFGNIQKYIIVKSSGNEKIDGAVKKALETKNNFEPPPPGMPKVMKFAVLLQG